MSLLGIDIGSGSCKGVIFDNQGRELARESRSYAAIDKSPFVEIDAQVFTDAVFAVIRALSERTGSDPIRSLAISSHGETFVAVDNTGDPVYPAIMNADNRATEQSEWWAQTFGKDRIYAITGVPLHPMFSLNKILWLRKHQPEVYEKADKFLSVGDFVLTQMGLPPATDYSLACRTMAFDIKKRSWSTDILHHCGVPVEKFPPAMPSGAVAGRLSAAMAAKLGLPEGTVVALGGHDQPCGALGAGAVSDRDVFDSAGTYECMVAVSSQPANSERALAYHLNSYCHVVPDKFVTLAFFPGGLTSNWFVEEFCREEKAIAAQRQQSVFELLNERVAALGEPTGVHVTPHLVGSCNPYWDVRATGMIGGLRPGIGKYHLYKAIFEGIACELAVNATALQEVLGDFERMRIAGGNARSPFTVQLRADLTGKAMDLLKTDEAVCLGAAILAGIGAGIYKDAADAAKKVVELAHTVEPDQLSGQKYQQQLKRYQLMYSSLAPYRES